MVIPLRVIQTVIVEINLLAMWVCLLVEDKYELSCELHATLPLISSFHRAVSFTPCMSTPTALPALPRHVQTRGPMIGRDGRRKKKIISGPERRSLAEI